MESYRRLELEFGAWLFGEDDPRSKNVVVCASGTASLHLALESFRLPLGSEVVTGDFNMIAVPRAIAMAGHTPVFVDCDERLTMDVGLLEMLGTTTAERALIAVHIYGRECAMEAIGYWCKVTCGAGGKGLTRQTWLIEDLAEAHGVKPNRYTDAACWSFFLNKHIHGEEGGAVWFRDPEHAALARQLRCLGFTPAHDYAHIPRGANYRLANSLADLILASLRKFDENMAIRRAGEALLDAACPEEWRQPKREAKWVYDCRIPGMSKETQDSIVAALQQAGVAARYGFHPMHLQEEFRRCRVIRMAGGCESLKASRECVYVPVVGVTEESARLVFEVIRRCLPRS